MLLVDNKIDYEYEASNNTSTTYRGDFSIATLNHDTDVFESLEEMEEKEADEHYFAMIAEKESINELESNSVHGVYANGY